MATTLSQRLSVPRQPRRRLLERLRSLQDDALRTRRQVLREGQPSGVMDVEEQSVDAEELGIGFSLLQLASQTLQGIETALRRLEAGVFGTCSDCRARIPDARLRALPFAALCVGCQEKHDGAAASATRPPPRPLGP